MFRAQVVALWRFEVGSTFNKLRSRIPSYVAQFLPAEVKEATALAAGVLSVSLGYFVFSGFLFMDKEVLKESHSRDVWPTSFVNQLWSAQLLVLTWTAFSSPFFLFMATRGFENWNFLIAKGEGEGEWRGSCDSGLPMISLVIVQGQGLFFPRVISFYEVPRFWEFKFGYWKG